MDAGVKVFLSYHVTDSSAAEGLRKGLRAEGLEVLDPILDADPGENLFGRAAKALEKAQAMVFLLSPEAVESPWIRKGLEYAITQLRFEGRVVPVIARPTKDLPWILRKLPILDLKPGPRETSRRAAALIRRTLNERRKQLGS